MKIPGTFDAPPDLPLLAPLSAGRQTFPVEPGDDPPAQGSLPATGLVAFSTTQGLSGTDYLDFRSECDVQYTRSLEEGTVLKVPYWEEVAASEECIIENHIAVNPADVLLQDKAMYFEALKPDEHPKELDKVYGRLADSLLIRNNGGIAPRLEKVRILDLVRASLDADGIGRAGTGPALDEDSAIVAQRKAFADALPQPPEATPKTTVERQIAEAVLFARKLSDHWPIVADVYQA
jgi:hypothetical protein